MNYSYRPNRDECDEIITALAKRYPACFFEEPKLRRPLRKDILADLHRDGVPFTPEQTAAAVKWYESHFAYQYALRAGAKRVDLNGREAGTVTLAEQRNAEFYIANRKQEMQAREVLPAFVRKPVALTRVVSGDPPRKVTVHPVVTAPEVPLSNAGSVDLNSARSIDGKKNERRESKSKQGSKMSPPCPTCGATGRVIHTVQVEGGAVIRTRRCLGGALHVFQTKETSISL
jgi:sRNA-binding protein